ncbi:MAG: hypothetical protein ACF8OB_18600 [Phycisphaeraceae bacterium JB051]
MKDYFRNPFPRHKAFGAYASPGPVVHLPLIFLIVGMSWILSNATLSMTVPTMSISIFCAMYLGRDLAIKAHYNLLITLTVYVLLLGSLSVAIRPLRQLHQWASEQAWGWPGWVFATLLLVLMCWQCRRHQQVSE